MTRESQRIDFEDKLYLAKINKVVDTARRDMTDQNTFVDSQFNGLSSLASFINDLRMETMAQQGWEKLVSILTKNEKIVQLLNRFNSIREEEMKNEKTHSTLEEYNLAKDMYIAVWGSLSSASKMEVKARREEIRCDGPTFL